ncbi:MAG: YicC/YloC family endoribonuclease [Eubacteriales bacterium]
MIRSMTAFGRARRTVDGRDITVEIKSVNNRFLDCSARLPRAYSFLEEKIKPRLVEAGINRGKVDVFVNIELVGESELNIGLNAEYAAEYIAALRQLSERFGLADDISVMTVARNSDVFSVSKRESDVGRDARAFGEVLGEAIEIFIAGREREGANLAADLGRKLDSVGEIVGEIEKLSQADTEGYRVKLEERLKTMLSDNKITFDESRILTECAIFADRISIDEELVRLRSHLAGFADTMRSGEPVGRRLDFLVQEINREINTIGSKCSNAQIAALVVDAKCEVEKMREQIQNIE